MTDYINDTFIQLTNEGRIKDAVAFCERVAEEAPYVEFRCIALKNLAECHFFMTGDGDACREANLRGLRLMEENEEILEGTPHMSRELVRRMYSDFCEQFRSVAVSFEEYEEYCDKPLKVRERNATERRGLKAVEQLKSKNAGWKENMFILLDQYFPQSQWSGRVPAAAQAACQAQLILLNRRKLRTQPLDVNYAMQQYQNCIVAAVENLISKAEENGRYPVEDQICFLFDRAEEVIESLRNDRQADLPTVETCLRNLAGARSHVENLCSDYKGMNQTFLYLTMESIEKDFDRQMDALRDVNLTGVDTGQNVLGGSAGSIGGGGMGGSGSGKGGCGCFLIAAVIIFIAAFAIWKLNLFAMGM